MNLYRTKRVLWLASVLLGAGTILAGLLGAFGPLQLGGGLTDARGGTPAADRADSAAEAGLPLKHYEVIWQRNLRRPLFDTPPAAKAAPSKPKLSVRLVGTVLEPGFTYGFFMTADGKTVLRRVGEKVAGAKVMSIADGEVTVLLAGETRTLKVEKEPSKP